MVERQTLSGRLVVLELGAVIAVLVLSASCAQNANVRILQAEFRAQQHAQEATEEEVADCEFLARVHGSAFVAAARLSSKEINFSAAKARMAKRVASLGGTHYVADPRPSGFKGSGSATGRAYRCDAIADSEMPPSDD